MAHSVSIASNLEEDVDNLRNRMFENIDKFVYSDQQSNQNAVLIKKHDINKSNRPQGKSTLGLLATLFHDNKKSKLKFRETYRLYGEINSSVQKRINAGGYPDIVTRERIRAIEQQETLTKVNVIEDEENELQEDDLDEGLRRLDFAESILFNPNALHMGSNYWLILKLFKYLRCCNIAGSIITLIRLRDMDFRSAEVVRAFDDAAGTGLMLNLLEVENVSVRVAAMFVLQKMTGVAYFTRVITFMDGVKALVNNLSETDFDLRLHAAKILSNLCIFKRARRKLRDIDGLQSLLCIFDKLITDVLIMRSDEERKPAVLNRSVKSAPARRDSSSDTGLNQDHWKSSLKLMQYVATALWKASRSSHARCTMLSAGVVGVLSRALKISQPAVLLPVISLLFECTTDTRYRVAVATEGMVQELVKHIRISNNKLKTQCALTLCRCAVEPDVRAQVRKAGGLPVLNQLLSIEVKSRSGALTLLASQVPEIHTIENERLLALYMPTLEGAPNETATRSVASNISFSDAAVHKPRLSILKLPSDKRKEQFKIATAAKKRQESLINSNQIDKSKSQLSQTQAEHLELLASLIGMVANLCQCKENAAELNQLGTTQLLIKLMHELPITVCAYLRPYCSASERLNGLDIIEAIINDCVLGLGALARIPEALRRICLNPDGIRPFILIMNMGPLNLVQPVCDTVAELVTDSSALPQFWAYGGVRLLVSFASSERRGLRLAALKALYACLSHNNGSVQLLKSLVGFMKGVIDLLYKYNNDDETLSLVCRVVAEMAKDKSCLAILTDLGVVGQLELLVTCAGSEDMRASVAAAVASCAALPNNVKALGKPEIIYSLMENMRTLNAATLRETAKALCALSRDKKVGRRIRQAGIHQMLLALVDSDDHNLQVAAATAINNINKVARPMTKAYSQLALKQQLSWGNL